ncbi:adenylate and guanylate cyclase catalytic domain-containing protein [Phthorimaea operculella]|nr:adenylate and guanylate cyclase catalytic domain-containing protein [Phthorimaea operculella]
MFANPPAKRAASQEALVTEHRILSYEETCGTSWPDTIAEGVLATLSAPGGSVLSVGWPGGRACALLAAARHPLPRACAAPAARAALLVRLAARLRWRRALLLPPTAARGEEEGCDECAATLRAARGALLAAGVIVRRSNLSLINHFHRPHVVIACATQWTLKSLNSVQSPVLLLHFASGDASLMSNITLDVGDSPYVPYVDTSKFNYNNTPLKEADSLNTKLRTHDTDAVRLPNATVTVNKPVQEAETITNETGQDLNHDFARKDIKDNKIQTSSMQLLLLSDVSVAPAGEVLSTSDLYRLLLDEMESQKKGIVYAMYHLYENFNLMEIKTWHLLTIFKTTAAKNITDEDWEITIETVNETDIWERLQATDEPTVEMKSYALAWSLVDEARRVPEGMETMLSCWLQQLHEFGGPELERPDLLQPAPVSAPSSTASGSRLALDRRTRYKGDAVQLKPLPLPAGMTTVELKRKATDVLLVLHTLRHENLNPFIGKYLLLICCLCETRPALVFDHCGRGSLEDVLMADEIKLDWTFRLSLLTDLVKGLRYLHASPLRVHGRLSSRNCVVDSRWVLRLTDYGAPEFYRTQGLTPPPRRARDRLWTAPELLRAGEGARGTQPGDVYSFAIIMQEVIVRGEPYCMLSLSPDEIVEKLCRPPPLIRPSVSMGAAPPEAVSVMRQCWAEAPDLRPDTDSLQDIFRLLHRGRKINIVDSMFEMLEKYSNNLEELIKERTEQLDMEKKKTEQLLNRMLPRSVAELLLLGLRVEPEEFEEVSIYFSDIVGFTELAARSTPVQVVALLNDLYTTFDAAIERYQVYKVETIGDAYMVVGGLPVRARDHAESVATMALHLLHLAGRFRIRHLPATPLHLRIGLHSGPCCAGVVGLTMPRYCLFGDTVNTASRMESTGAAWRIQVSGATAARLEAAGGYRLRSRGLTMIKGKGAMHTYWLLGKEGFDKPLPTPPPLPVEEALIEHESESEADPPAPAAPALLSPGARSADGDALHTHDKYAWTRSGAVSADSSPPAAPYSRYRCIGGGGRVLRRQWSLERGEALAAARAQHPADEEEGAGGRGGDGALQPLALAAAPPRAIPRYRMRPDPEAPHMPTSTSFD